MVSYRNLACVLFASRDVKQLQLLLLLLLLSLLMVAYTALFSALLSRLTELACGSDDDDELMLNVLRCHLTY